MANRILVINLGATSSKMAIFEGEKEIAEETIDHSVEEMKGMKDVNEQYDMRLAAVRSFLNHQDLTPADLDGIAARGGCVAELETGAYLIDAHFVDLSIHTINPHVAQVGIKIAYELGREGGAKPYTYDLVCGTGKPK